MILKTGHTMPNASARPAQFYALGLPAVADALLRPVTKRVSGPCGWTLAARLTFRLACRGSAYTSPKPDAVSHSANPSHQEDSLMATMTETKSKTQESGQTAVERVMGHAERIKAREVMRGEQIVAPGEPTSMSPALREDECIAQGDLLLRPCAKPPEGYVQKAIPANGTREYAQLCRLVPGPETKGSSHVLSSLEGVELWHPADGMGGTDGEGYLGPWFIAKNGVTVEHGKQYGDSHGAVVIPENFGVQCQYQRMWDSEQARERRTRD